MEVTASGNVGIGTTNPQSTLQVQSGYIQVPWVTTAPPAADCDQDSEVGRMRVSGGSGQLGYLYICIKDSSNTIKWRQVQHTTP